MPPPARHVRIRSQGGICPWERAMKRRGWLVRAAVVLVAAPLMGLVVAGEHPALGDSPSPIVIDGQARFEVLSPTLIRLEYAADGNFEDRATFNAVNRGFPVPSFSTSVSGG